MKSEESIKQRLSDLKATLNKKEIEYSSLDQISALDSTGKKLYEEIENIKGRVDALKWVLL